MKANADLRINLTRISLMCTNALCRANYSHSLRQVSSKNFSQKCSFLTLRGLTLHCVGSISSLWVFLIFEIHRSHIQQRLTIRLKGYASKYDKKVRWYTVLVLNDHIHISLPFNRRSLAHIGLKLIPHSIPRC